MTRNPPSMAELGEYVVQRLGAANFLGIIGDDTHFNGYHLGPSDISSQDYSLTTDRDRAGAKLGNYASAIDIGMGWDGSRSWFAWLVKNARQGMFPDLVELNGSVDGRISYYFNHEDGFAEPPIAGVDHVGHSHLGFFRDSIYRSQLAVLEPWPPSQPKPPVASPTPGVLPSRMATRPQVEVEEVAALISWRACVLAGGVGALSWIIRRRMEADREDSRKNSR